ncbi:MULTISPECIES: quinoprotein dehydrogenase-associated SoxYZ-like carrier [Alphaproteobacteria]|uniref:Quinoprotein dehydrogenase-associated SoxYZ-like carrier n=2 Tax=Alphaproteobacteria TaxID=28211 RepID=A0A512HPI9_9HYPH|nr:MULTISPECIES: quinoprotein dehydrogenase-associated SoxYZ-like carrier [Alphaproteobacteria]GEO87290.1 quinoprotein dehydrogenase-associated SoxYZ-like carrier [Ciceribacter naphthalenivorans]GLR23720.1 quinoprotein dehydrogenase-associated SoxYZ-like carrier [Ciceribacter naphthalenivorans]GLT06576.1 quinoprotein dehydrogenase-associated SoxYZ-like carrier [Sphingomonas psychrolutea]
MPVRSEVIATKWGLILAMGLELTLTAASPALAEDQWPGIQMQLYGDRPVAGGEGMITLDAPYRSDNDARTVMGATLLAPAGRSIRDVSLILDQNPMPVSAVIHLSRPIARFAFEATLRVNGPTPVHVVTELDNGTLYAVEGFVKTSGQGACSAPPGSNPEAALATLGNMEIEIGSLRASGKSDLLTDLARLRNQQVSMSLKISHPSHSGMQMDQISLLFIPMRYVERVDIDLDGQRFADVTGSISLSENPEFTLSIPAASHVIDVTMTDTDGTVTRKSKTLTSY